MKLEQIQELWAEDSKINRERLDEELIKISILHAKYFKIFSNERLVLMKYQDELKVLKKMKYDFYTQGPTKETIELGWEMPPIGKVLKAEVSSYIDSDKHIIELSKKIGLQHEKISLLESIIKVLMNRGYNIKTLVDYIKFTSGG